MGKIEVRYAVLWHSRIQDPHFDVLIETYPRSELATWRSPCWPIEKPTVLIRVKDHRRVYLDYEGELSGRRGTVERVAAGKCEIEIGENAAWTVEGLDQPLRLILKQIAGERWQASP